MEIHKNYLLLHGGVDISPSRYHEQAHPYTQKPSVLQDEEEFRATSIAFQNKLPVIGICRGAQLLCIMNGGKLYQHSAEHGSSHDLLTFNNKRIKQATASHHQIMRLDNTEHELLAWAPHKTFAYDQHNKEHILEKSPEIVYFPKTNSLAIQPHPEWSNPNSDFRVFVDELVYKYFELKDIF